MRRLSLNIDCHRKEVLREVFGELRCLLYPVRRRHLQMLVLESLLQNKIRRRAKRIKLKKAT